jgi:phage shock protein C
MTSPPSGSDSPPPTTPPPSPYYCTHCGSKIDPSARFCPSCGSATSSGTAAAAAAPPASSSPPAYAVTRKTISRDRAILAYIMGILISGTGHMVVGRVARGILILVGAVVVGLVTSYIFIGLFLVAIFVYWLLQLIDLYKQIHRMEVVKT